MKRVLCLLLCLLIVVPAAFSTAESRDISVSNLNVTLTIPAAGSKMNTPPVLALSDSHCKVTYSAWVYESDDNFFEYFSSQVFEAGKEYMTKITIDADDGYCFTEADLNSITSNATVYWRSRSIGGYSAFIVLKFKIPKNAKMLDAPKSVKLTALSAKKIQVSWKTLSSSERKKVRNIEIQISTDKNFTTIVKTKKVSSGKSSYTFSGLKKNTKYYVRVRSCPKSDEYEASKWVVKNKKTKK